MSDTQIQKFIESNDIISNPNALHSRLRKEGYLFFRNLLPQEDVLNLQHRILKFCDEAGWIKKGTDWKDGLTNHKPLVEGEPGWEPVYEKLQKCEEFHRLKLHPNVLKLMESLFEEKPFCLPCTIGRIAFPHDNERATAPHQDWLYVQGSSYTLTCWAPVGDIPQEVGGLKILVGSHKTGFLVSHKAQGPGGNTVPIDPTLPWAATDYRAGDVLIFLPMTIHGALPNQTPDRLRLSMDFRYTGISHTVTENWLKPHFNWLGARFSWDNLDKDWNDQSLRRYWERMPVKTRPHEERVYARD